MKYLLIIFLILGIQGCATSENAPQIKTTYFANAQVNPNIMNKPAPLVVTMYQLKTDSIIKNTDFISLYTDPKAALESSIISREQIEIKPNQQIETTQDLDPDTRYLAIIAAYRDIDNAQWRKLIKVKNNAKSLKLQITFGKKEIDIQQG